MFAVGLVRDKPGIQSFQIPEPGITQPDAVLVKVTRVGLDGTDFSLVRYDEKNLPQGKDELVLGHEMVGIVQETGPEVRTLKPGDIVTMTVRRGCGLCHPCLHGQSDMCLTGLYTERGIYKADGFLTRYVVDREQYVVKVPPDLERYAVLTEPLSIAEKGVEQIRLIQSRLPWTCPHPEHTFSSPNWGECKTALVIGAGPLGFLATCLLRLAGVTTYVAEIVPENNFKIKMIQKLGAKYLDVRGKKPQEVGELGGTSEHLDIVFEASGASELALGLIPYMSRGSIYVMTGVPHGERKAEIDADRMLRQIVLQNQVIVGSVNSNRSHFELALKDMREINRRFGDILAEVCTHSFKLEEYESAFHLHEPDQLKVIMEV
jgi:threonine dehydrogenase-like Zn-dependent dehydrogenase